MEAYHQLSFLPNTPHAIDRLRNELRQRAESLGQTTLQIGHRALAHAIECSAARLSELMSRLELAGEIIREPFKNTFLIDVSPLIDPSANPDRSPLNTDTPTLIDHPMPDHDLSHQDAVNSVQIRERVEMHCKVLRTHDQNQEEELAQPLFERLIAEPNMNPGLAAKIATNPLGTLSDFLHDCQIAQSLPGVRTPFFFTVSRWCKGQRVVASQETPHEQPTHSQPATRRASRRAHTQHGRRDERSSASRGTPSAGVDPAVYAAILASATPLDIDLDDDL